MRRTSNLFAALFLIMNLATARSTQKTVTTRYVQYDPYTGEPVTVKKETTTTTEDSGAGAAVLSGTPECDRHGHFVARPCRRRADRRNSLKPYKASPHWRLPPFRRNG